jgi:peptidyl-prolyl cis-trans isomerase B (cyclophilin B)
VLGATWALGGFDGKSATTDAAGSCLWVPKSATSSDGTPDTGTPPAGELRSGFETMTITTNLGVIEALLDLSKAPCTAASFGYLGSKAFFNGSNCHRLSTAAKTLTCGDPKSDGTGGPSYQFADEDVPTTPVAAATPTAAPSASVSASPSESATPTGPAYYAKGTIVLVNTGANTNGSQFSIVYGDGSTLSAAYSIVGTVTKGLDIVEKVAEAGAVDAENKVVAEGKPTTTMTIQQLTVTVPGAAGTEPTTTTEPTTAPTTEPSVGATVEPTGVSTPTATASAAAQ